MSKMYFFQPISVQVVVTVVLFVLTACTNTRSEYSSGSSFAQVGAAKIQQEFSVTYPNRNPSVTEGKEIWSRNNCASCHGDDGHGSIACHLNLADEFYMYRKTPLELYRLLSSELPKKGHPELKESGTKLWDLVFFLRSLSCPPMTEHQLADIEPFFVANCAQCHGRQGYGDGELAQQLEPRPANFHQYNRLFDRQDFMLFNHIGDGLYPAAMPPWRGYKDPYLNREVDNRYIKKLVQYVRHFHVDAGKSPLVWWDEEKNGAAPILDAADLKNCCNQK